MTIDRLVKLQKNFYYTGASQSYTFRMEALCRLEQAVKSHEKQLIRALKKDLNKSGFESYMTEVGLFYSEINYAKKHLKDWMKPQRKPTPVSQFHAKSFDHGSVELSFFADVCPSDRSRGCRKLLYLKAVQGRIQHIRSDPAHRRRDFSRRLYRCCGRRKRGEPTASQPEV